MLASQNGHEPRARALIEARPSVEKYDVLGRTALMLAFAKGHEPCIRALIEAEAGDELSLLLVARHSWLLPRTATSRASVH